MATIQRKYRQLIHPFANVTADPKIPDGACSLSLGQPYMVSKMINFANSSNGDIILLLYAGLHHTLAYTREPATAVVAGTIPAPYNTAEFTDDVIHINLKTPNYRYVAPDEFGLPANQSKISKWRIVSVGLKLLMVNNADSTQGWWEAIRINPSDVPQFWEPDLGTTTVPIPKEGDVLPVFTMSDNGVHPPTYYHGTTAQVIANWRRWDSLFDVTPATDLAETRSYTMGRLRELDTVTFKLQQYEPTHPFTKIETGGNVSKLEAKNMVVDQNMDMILIKLHGVGGASLNPTKIVLNLVSNQEWIMAPDDPLAAHMTENRPDPRTIALVTSNKHNTDIRAGTTNEWLYTKTGGMPLPEVTPDTKYQRR